MIVDRVKELLESITNEEFQTIIKDKHKNNGSVYRFIAPDVVALGTNIYSNLNVRRFPEEHLKISKLLIEKCIDCMDYSCDYELKMSWGKYLWCGTTGTRAGHGFTLTNSTCTDSYGNPYSHMMLLNLIINPKLAKHSDFYDIYTYSGGLFDYNLGTIGSNIITFKKIAPELIGTDLEIIFSKKKNLTPEENEIVKKRLLRTPREEIFKIKITIPDISQYGDMSDCAICLETVDEPTNKYISPCGHLFHLECIFKYLESKNLLYPICQGRSCCGAKKPKPFECVVCKNLITK